MSQPTQQPPPQPQQPQPSPFPPIRQKPKRRWPLFLIIGVLALILLGSCLAYGPISVDPADGPAASAEPSVVDPSVTEGGGATEEPTEEPTEPEPTQPTRTATFKEKYTYVDGLQVEVTKIVNGKLTAKDVEYSSDEKAGEAYTKFTIRVKNGTNATVELGGDSTVSYGPDGTEAEVSYAFDYESLDGKLLPGKSRSVTEVYRIPAQHRKDVVLEFTATWLGEYDSAVFAGSVL